MQHLQSNSTLQSGKYKIISLLGQGGFGITYLAEQAMLHRKVAIKEFFMKEHCNRDEETSHVSVGSMGSIELVNRFKEKFIKEAGLIASMNNHHIVQIHDIFEENGTAYYVMEHIDGCSLNTKVKSGALSEELAKKYILEVADALSYIHAKNILHLDVKPANILLRDNKEAVLIDFGISKRYDDNGGQTSTTPVGISKGYAPIEQYNQGLQTFTPATDVYSLGATLYKLVTGVTPPEAALLLNDDEELERPDGISFATWTAIEKAMEPKVKRRPQNIEEFLSLLGTLNASPSSMVNATPESPIDENFSEDTIVIKVEMPDKAEESKPINNPNYKIFDVKGVKFKMIIVEGGTFDMKETVSCGFLGLSSKEIIQKTTLSDYWIGETQVTQALWKTVMDKNPSNFKGNDLPVESVSWDDCKTFISKLNSLTGKNFLLPTEAEWEFAARGGINSKNTQYSGCDNIDSVAWYNDNSDNKTHPVGTKQPNELGIYDMSGNVWEWCSDWHGKYRSGTQTSPKGANRGSYRVCRGGSWGNDPRYCRSSGRGYERPVHRDRYLGFRLCLSD